MSANVLTDGQTVELIVGGARTGGQLGQWGEKGVIARKVWDKVLELAPKTPDAPDAAPAPPKSEATLSTASELERRAKLHKD